MSPELSPVLSPRLQALILAASRPGVERYADSFDMRAKKFTALSKTDYPPKDHFPPGLYEAYFEGETAALKKKVKPKKEKKKLDLDERFKNAEGEADDDEVPPFRSLLPAPLRADPRVSSDHRETKMKREGPMSRTTTTSRMRTMIVSWYPLKFPADH